MKKLLIPLLFALPLHAYAENNIYVEGQLNYNNPKDVSTKKYSGPDGYGLGITFTDAELKNKYDSETDAGIEIGLANIADTNFRLGLSYTKTSFKLDKSTITGSVTNGVITYASPPALEVTSSQWSELGLTFDNDVKLYMANAYYDFEIDENFKPFIGLGMGMADIENAKDKEFTYSGTVGARYFFNEKVYLGGKFAYSVINGPEDQFGIEYDDIDLYTTSLILGYEF